MSILQDKSFQRSIILTILFLGTGIIFLYTDLAAYGWIFFVVLPVILGISIGALPNRKWAYYGLIATVVIFLILLLAGGLEGMICVLMALPVIIPLLFLGSVISHLVKRYREIKSTEQLNLLVLPLIIFVIAAPLEKFLTADDTQVAELRTEITLPYSTIQVYDAIKSVDTLVAEKPFLMKLDLPVPQKCVLEKEEVGGIRTCYFDGGKIVERITELEKGKILRMDVIDYELTGADWLGFREAIYLFEALRPDQCKMTRITTYSSKLNPRFYWEPLEKIGIGQEHEFVFENLKNDLKRKMGTSRRPLQRRHPAVLIIASPALLL